MHQPLVSVVIPVYNCQAYIAQAVRSALEQDHPNKEVIVVNDGSTDGTLAVLREFGDAIRVVDQPNGGPPRARNAGLRAVRGDYVAFLDADDVWVQGKLSAQVAYMEAHPEVGTSYTRWHVWQPGADGSFTPPAFAYVPLRSAAIDATRSGWIYRRLLFDCELLTTTVMIRTTVVRQVGEFDVNRFSGEDYDYWIRLSQVAEISCLDVVGALYRVVPDSVSRRPHEINNEHAVITTAVARFGLFGPDGAPVDPQAMRLRMNRLVFQHGYVHLRQGDPSIALRAFAQNLRLQPLQPKLWVHALGALLKVAVDRKTSSRAD